jgi:hypothetical protein
MSDDLDIALDDLAEARAKLEAARDAIRQLQDAALGDTGAFRQLASRLDRLAAELARIERVVEDAAINLPTAGRS